MQQGKTRLVETSLCDDKNRTDEQVSRAKRSPPNDPVDVDDSRSARRSPIGKEDTSSGWRRLGRISSRLSSVSAEREDDPEPAAASLPARPMQQPELTQPVFSDLSANAQTSDLILGALKGTGAPAAKPAPTTPPKQSKPITPAIVQRSRPIGASESSSKGRRDPSPFFRARRSREKARERAASPEVGPLEKDVESDGESVVSSRRFRPQASAYEDEESGTEPDTDSGSDDDNTFVDDGEDFFDEETEKNTEANAFFHEGQVVEPEDAKAVLDSFGEEIEQDILGEGPNVVEPPQPVFQSAFEPRRRKSKAGLDLTTSRPTFARDRCTISLTHGDPDASLEDSGKRLRRYVVLSDLSNESRYAVEWAIGTVARDGDEVFLISVKEDESKGEWCLECK